MFVSVPESLSVGSSCWSDSDQCPPGQGPPGRQHLLSVALTSWEAVPASVALRWLRGLGAQEEMAGL